jgi:hypothetical protein
MNNNIKSSVAPVRISRQDSVALREKFAARRLEDEVEKKVDAILAAEREKRVSKGEKLRREMVNDSLAKGARRGARSPEESCVDETLFAKRLG